MVASVVKSSNPPQAIARIGAAAARVPKLGRPECLSLIKEASLRMKIRRVLCRRGVYSGLRMRNMQSKFATRSEHQFEHA